MTGFHAGESHPHPHRKPFRPKAGESHPPLHRRPFRPCGRGGNGPELSPPMHAACMHQRIYDSLHLHHPHKGGPPLLPSPTRGPPLKGPLGLWAGPRRGGLKGPLGLWGLYISLTRMVCGAVCRLQVFLECSMGFVRGIPCSQRIPSSLTATDRSM